MSYWLPVSLTPFCHPGRRVGVGAGKLRKRWEKWPGNEKRRERALSAFWRLVLGFVVPQKNKKLLIEESNLRPGH